ncbi:hypothetical protein ACFE04_017851 [Oxalis oulophora]
MDKKGLSKWKRKELGLSCMLNTEVGAVLAVLRRPPDATSHYLNLPEETVDAGILGSLRSLRALIFNPQQEWRTIDPSIYVSPFLDVIQSDDIPATATGVAISAILKIINLGIFDAKTPGAKDAMHAIVMGITSCRLEKTDSVSEDAVMMRILQVLTGIMKHPASILLTDHNVCTVVNTCFQVIQQSASRGDLLQRSATYTMHELIQAIFSRLPDFEIKNGEDQEAESDSEDADVGDHLDSGYGIRSAIDIFHFLCSLLNVVDVVESEGSTYHTADDDVQLFALVLINSAIELSGDAIGRHPKLLRMIQDDLFHHLIHYGSRSRPLVLSMICSTVLNIYHFLRRSIRPQLEAFFTFVSFRVAALGAPSQLQEMALEGMINFCRQPTFVVEVYVNYDCDPTCRNVFEEIGKLICRHSFPGGGPLTALQIQAFEGLMVVIHHIADNIDKENDSRPTGPFAVQVTEYRPIWEEKSTENLEVWIEHIRFRKAQKKKLLVAENHFNRDDKKGLEYLKLSQLVSDPPDPKAYAFFYRYTPGLDKTTLGEYFGDPGDFPVAVLKDFTDTFEFGGMNLDTALRTYLETFRLPGESQKIQRILEAFSERFYQQQSSGVFSSRDAVLVFCYSLIMLNTDLHNPQVKKKMTEDEFIRNNRQINDGKDLPREYLSELFNSISTKAISLSGQTGPLEMNPGRWLELMNKSKIMKPFIISDFDRRLGRDMFACIAGPTVAALCAFFEHADEDEMLNECIEGLISVARIAQYGLEDTLDELLASFCKFTTLLNPYASPEETMFAFSNDLKPKMATLAVFTVANNFGESIRGGWRNIVDCLLKLKKLKLLPQSVIEFENTHAMSDDPAHMRTESGIIFPNEDTFNKRSNFSSASTNSNSSAEENAKAAGNYIASLFAKLGESLRKTSLARREELRNQAIASLHRSFALAGELEFTSTSIINCFNLVIFAMVDDLHEKMLEYSRRDNAEREMRGMEGTLKLAMELLTDVYMQYLKQLSESPAFRTFWLGVLRRMDTCMKADLGEFGKTILQDIIPGLLQKMIMKMKETDILVPKEDDDLWEITYVQIQWIAPSLKDDLFPELASL